MLIIEAPHRRNVCGRLLADELGKNRAEVAKPGRHIGASAVFVRFVVELSVPSSDDDDIRGQLAPILEPHAMLRQLLDGASRLDLDFPVDDLLARADVWCTAPQRINNEQL